MILNAKYDRNVIIYAFRYAMNRQSYASSIMQNKLDEIWDQLPVEDQQQIIREALENRGTYDTLSSSWVYWAKLKGNVF